MIYDDQPQMENAVEECLVDEGVSFVAPRRLGKKSLASAFAAIDREALIDKAVAAFPRSWGIDRSAVAEKVLVAAGIIPEREQRTDRNPQDWENRRLRAEGRS